MLLFLLISIVYGLSPTQLAEIYRLSTSTSFAFPTTTQAANDFIVSNWSLGKGRIQDNPQNIAFVSDPFPDRPPPQPVLQVTYDKGSYSHNSGGTQWYNLWNSSDGSPFRAMIVSYEVAFDKDFEWIKGGKLPGLRGGLNSTGCSGGNESDGQSCFSARLMWRNDGAGEVYAYIPTTNNLCKQDQVICNSDFGISLHRGSFSFSTGRWNRVTLFVQLNDPPNIANGNIQLFYNDILAINQTNLQIRSSNTVSVNGLYFSTFFGGSDESWATPSTTHAYFRNMQLWGGNSHSGATLSSASTITLNPKLVFLLIICILVYQM